MVRDGIGHSLRIKDEALEHRFAAADIGWDGWFGCSQQLLWLCGKLTKNKPKTPCLKSVPLGMKLCHYGKPLAMSDDSDKLGQSVKAHRAICDMLKSLALSDQTKRQLKNLKRLLELEISSLKAQQSDGQTLDTGSIGQSAN